MVAVDTLLLRQGNRRALARAITLVESTLESHRKQARELMERLLPLAGQSIRVGISGVPGVGKSTFIESLGLHLISMAMRVAVLAVDPSSPIRGGSILADKIRMEGLSRSDHAFIRPSPSAGIMGGVAERTRECLLLCEAAGYDVILVETVGVGQSEFEVAEMVDFFLVLMIPNSGDELQGMKKGILEVADGLVINKADGESVGLAERTQKEFRNAFQLVRHPEFWSPRVLTCSALEETGVSVVWEMIQEYRSAAQGAGWFQEKRARQDVGWMNKLVDEGLRARFQSQPAVRSALPELEREVLMGESTPYHAACRALELLR